LAYAYCLENNEALSLLYYKLLPAVWLNSNRIRHVNEVTLHRARLLTGWVTFCRHSMWPGIIASNASQLSLATSQWMGKWILTVATLTAKDVMVCFYPTTLLPLGDAFSSSSVYTTKPRVSTDRWYFQGCRLTQQKCYERRDRHRTVAWPCRRADAAFQGWSSRYLQAR